MRFSIQVLLLLLLTSVVSLGQEPEVHTPDGFAPLWLEKDGQFTPEALEATLNELSRLQDDPEQIVVFIHGFKKPRAGSTRDYNTLVKRLRPLFESDQSRVGFVGVQWDSAVDIPSSKGLDALRMIRAYHDMVPVARTVGRGPTRALLLALQEKYPKAHISLLAHSMGCEVAAAAVLPEITYLDHKPFGQTHRPQDDVQLDMLVLAGSDLDYDFWYKSGIEADEVEERTRLIWFTVADYLSKGDKALNTRRRIRGMAGGSAFPRMTLPQLDQAVAERRIFIDHKDIPRSHQFLDYYTDERLERMVAVLRYLTVPRAQQPEEITDLDEILAAPHDLELLLSYLDHPNYASKFYATWRIERINCGDARHMTDLTLEEVVELLRHDPKKIEEFRQTSPCISVKKGLIPSPKAMKAAGIKP
ncbi:MAG: alpha/beta hydrolase [Vulcanimicrobiota bacterium]